MRRKKINPDLNEEYMTLKSMEQYWLSSAAKSIGFYPDGSRINQDSPQKLKIEEDIVEERKSFSKPFFEPNYKGNLLLELLLKTINIEAEVENKREAVAK